MDRPLAALEEAAIADRLIFLWGRCDRYSDSLEHGIYSGTGSKRTGAGEEYTHFAHRRRGD